MGNLPNKSCSLIVDDLKLSRDLAGNAGLKSNSMLSISGKEEMYKYSDSTRSCSIKRLRRKKKKKKREKKEREKWSLFSLSLKNKKTHAQV